jgi:hypothetical protein
MPQLAKQHGDELAPAAETAGAAPGLVLPDGSLQLQPRHELQHLRKNARYSIHGGSLSRLTSILAKQAQPAHTAATRHPQRLIWTSLVGHGFAAEEVRDVRRECYGFLARR